MCISIAILWSCLTSTHLTLGYAYPVHSLLTCLSCRPGQHPEGWWEGHYDLRLLLLSCLPGGTAGKPQQSAPDRLFAELFTTNSVPLTAEGPCIVHITGSSSSQQRLYPTAWKYTSQPASAIDRVISHFFFSPSLSLSCYKISSLPVSCRICIGLEVVLKTVFHLHNFYFWC